MNNVIFITDQFGDKKIYDNKGLVGVFKDSYSNVIKGDDGILRRTGRSLWYMILSDPDKIERAKNYPGFGTSFKLSENEPVWNTLGNIKTLQDPNSMAANMGKMKADITQQVTKTLKADIEAERKQLAIDSKRYGELWSQICKAGGGYLKDADPNLIAEFETLRVKLGIKETPVEET